jgi:hypothetical protein
MITPGPVVITTAFIGYLMAGPLGGTIAALAVFLPCYLFVVIPASYFRRVVGNPVVMHSSTASRRPPPGPSQERPSCRGGERSSTCQWR